MSTSRRLVRTAPVLVLMGIFFAGDRAGESATGMSLPPPREKGKISIEEAIAQRRSVRAFQNRKISLQDIGQILWAGQGITDRSRGFRASPSAGALFPLTLYLYTDGVTGVESGVYRYETEHHSLVRVRKGDVRSEIVRAALGQGFLGRSPAGILIAADYETTTRKYGRRGRRYVEIEVGHAAQNIWLQAISLGLGAGVAGAFDDSGISQVFRLPEGMDPLYLIAIGYPQ